MKTPLAYGWLKINCVVSCRYSRAGCDFNEGKFQNVFVKVFHSPASVRHWVLALMKLETVDFVSFGNTRTLDAVSMLGLAELLAWNCVWRCAIEI